MGKVGSGDTYPPPGTYNTINDTIEVKAIPSDGWTYDHWVIDGQNTSYSNPLVVNTLGNHTLLAVFEPLQYSLELNTLGNGIITASPSQITYDSGTNVQLVAVPAEGWVFDGWSGAISNFTNPITINMNEDTIIKATFKQDPRPQVKYLLTVKTAGSGNGTVTLDPPGGSYAIGTEVALSARPEVGSSFSGWNGSLTNSSVTKITITRNETVTATFVKNIYNLTVIINPTNSGSVTRDHDGPYHLNETVTLTESPNEGYTFSGWSGEEIGSESLLNVTISGDAVVTANFVENSSPTAPSTPSAPSQPSTPSTPTYTLTINTSGQGSVSKSPSQTTYVSGSSVQLTAIPSPGWQFTSWSGDLSGSANPATVTVDDNKAVTATFTLNTYTLTVTVSPTSGGTVTKSPNQSTYHFGDTVTFTESPSAGYTFSAWSGDGTGTGTTRTVTITGNMAVTATFTQVAYTITASAGSGGVISPSGSVSVGQGSSRAFTITPNSGYAVSGVVVDGSSVGAVSSYTFSNVQVAHTISASFTQSQYTLTVNVVGTGCSVSKSPSQASYTYGSTVQLTPVAAAGWTFSRWSGALSGSANPATITMSGNKAVTVTFTQNRYTLTISTSGSGSTSPSTGSRSYGSGSQVQVTATPASGWSFSHWHLDGADAGSSNPTTVTMNSAHTLQAVFTQNTYTLTVSVTGSGSTTPAAGSYVYSTGSSVPVTASPVAGWSFDHWVLDGSSVGSANPYTVLMNGGHTLGAVFTQDQYTLSVNISGQGSVSKSPSQATYTYGASVQMTATPAAGWTFMGWSGDASGFSNPLSLTVNGNMAVTATFTQVAYTITASAGSGGVISPSGSVSVGQGSSRAFTITPNSGYAVSGVVVDGSSVGAVSSYTFSNVQAAHTISASFTQSQYTLTVNVNPSSGGTVTRNNNGPYDLNDVVVLTESPSAGYTFSAWSGDGTGTGTTRTVTVTGNMIVTATYTQDVYALALNTVGSGSGSVNLSPIGGSYTYGTVVTLTANPAAGSTFTGWGGGLSGSANPASVTITSAQTVTATFTHVTYTLTIQSPDGSGSTSLTVGGHTYNQGDTAQITASPSSGWLLDHWVQDGSSAGSSNPISLTMNSAHTLGAVFTQTISPPVSSKPYVDGIVIKDPNGDPLRLHGWNIYTTATLSDLQWLKANGYNSVRVVIYWSDIESTEGTYKWAQLDSFLANCQAVGVWAIIDFHQWNWSSYFTSNGAGIGFPKWLYDNSRGYGVYSPTDRQRAMDEFYQKNTANGALFWGKFVNLWTAMVTRYKDNPYVWAYEIINEPMVGAAHVNAARSACMDRYREIIPIIRAIDPNTIITLQSIDTGYNQKVDYANIVWTRSCYPQYEPDLTSVLTRMKNEFNVGMGVPYIVSETGAQPSYQSQADARLTEFFTKVKSIINGGNNEVWHCWLYGKGVAAGWQGPRNSDGSDSWIQAIIDKQ
jgi:uncharacterized repeat protein (TIGR02543 family)